MTAPSAAPIPPGDGSSLTVEVPPDASGKWGNYRTVPESSPHVGSAGRSRTTSIQSDITPLGETGPTDARLDVVIIGDGYTADEQDEFVDDATARWDEMSAIEPYASYRGLVNVWLVEAVSKDSGVSRDSATNPGAVDDKDTAIGSYFWCNGIQRLLCVDTERVAHYGAQAPGFDHAFVVANTTRYGGAGYFKGPTGGGLDDDYPVDGIATLSAKNSSSSLVAAHEVGHSLGTLADEYFYCTDPKDPACTHDPELGDDPSQNITIHGGEGEQWMQEHEHKWYRWLGETDPAGGVTGLHEGGGYVGFGMWRPTEDSIMRSLSRTAQFNNPGREQMVRGFYRYGQAMTSKTPSGTRINRSHVVTVDTAELGALADLTPTRWYVNGREVVEKRGHTSFDPREAKVLPWRAFTLSARVDDDTALVRDPQIQAEARTHFTWSVRADTRPQGRG